MRVVGRVVWMLERILELALPEMAGAILGNRCGHDPNTPRLFAAPEEHRDRPPVIRELIRRVADYYADPSKIPTLNAANASDRQQRSERREACVALLQAILHYTDLVTLRVGLPGDEGEAFTALPLRLIASRAGLTMRRAWRAVRALRLAGLLGVHVRSEEVAPGSWRARAAIRTVPAALFSVFGLGEELKRERKKASKRRREAVDAPPPPPHAERGAGRQALGAAALKELMGNLADAPVTSGYKSKRGDRRRE